MTQHPTEPGLIAPGGGETAETDILEFARKLLDGPRPFFLKDRARYEALAALTVEVEALRGVVARAWQLEVALRLPASPTIRGEIRTLCQNVRGDIADVLASVLRGDQ